MPISIDPKEVKKKSEAIILNAGGQICDWLPYLDRTESRSKDKILARALILNAMLNIHFKAPTEVIRQWIESHKLTSHLSEQEKRILHQSNSQLDKQSLIDLYWYIESLWALMWVGGLIKEMPFNRCVEDFMASLAPNLEQDEGPEKFSEKMVLRSDNEIFEMLDLYFRLHWWTRDGALNGRKTGDVEEDVIMERRKALEWVMDDDLDWDDVPMNT